MESKNMSNVLVMALFMITRSDVISCAGELGVSPERLTEGAIEHIQELISQELGDWHTAVRGIIKEAIREIKMRCPLGMTCSPDCTYRQVGDCEAPGELL